MTGSARAAALAAAAVVFVLVATANSSGYRYGISDQAFYQPALAAVADATLFPRDRVVFDVQMRYWPGGVALGQLGALLGQHWPALFFGIYILTLIGLFAAALAAARALRLSPWATTAFVALLTLRHRIAKTGANTLEGYMHPRMLAFALGLAACAAMFRARWTWAAVAIAGAAIVHPTTACWFAGVWIVAIAVWAGHQRAIGAALSLGVVGVLALAWTPLGAGLTRMDDAWLAVLGEKDYLFASGWPAYAWITNLAYPLLLVLIWQRRAKAGVAAPGEAAVIAGACALVVVFLASVPAADARIAFAVQLQVNRVFWLLDALVMGYLAWALVDGTGRRPTVGRAIAIALVTIAVARGTSVTFVDAGRMLFAPSLAATDWTDAMRWLTSQPVGTHVLADPGHAWKYGSSVRVAAARDVLVEASKDAAISMYDRSMAMRTAERMRALDGFEVMDATALRALAARFDLDVLVEPVTRVLDLPVRYRNAGFVVYDLR